MSEQQRGKRAIQARFDEPEVAAINKYRRDKDEIPTWAEAIRELVKRGLAASKRRDQAA